MGLEKCICAFARLGEILMMKDNAIRQAHITNPWFTEDNVRYAISAIASNLTESNLQNWLKPYTRSLEKTRRPKRVGVVMAGNVPLVGFHDFLCVLLSGHIFVGKLSSKDDALLPALAKLLISIEPNFSKKIKFTAGFLKNTDAIIATGSNNTNRYFEYYFGRYPHLFRRNRSSVAVLTGRESQVELNALGDDIFRYFGLGCRNVAKLYVPEGYDYSSLFKTMEIWKHLTGHKKYANNYLHHRSLFLMNRIPFHDTGFLLLKEYPSPHAPTSVIHFEYYRNRRELMEKIRAVIQEIQCIVCSELLQKELSESNALANGICIPFGRSQMPRLHNYLDRVDTMQFLLRL